MNTTLLASREQTHPPLSPTNERLLDRVAVWSGNALLAWAQRSELQRSERLARQRERSVRQLDADRFWQEVADQRAKTETYMLFRSLQ